MSKQGFYILFIGKMGRGKTPYIKRLVENNNLKRLVADVRKEYPITYTRRFIDSKEDYEEFMWEAEHTKNSNIIIEEGTAFFNGYNEMDLLRFATGIQHNHCIGYFAFHAIRKTPQTLIDLARYIVLFETGESIKNIIKKDERFVLYMKHLRKEGLRSVVIDKEDETKWKEQE
jgi:hypothetical protein